MEKTIVVTGSSGFIGRHIAREYKNNGYYVIGMGHGCWESHEWGAWGIDRWYCCDITLEALRLSAECPEIIIHCAGSGSIGETMKSPIHAFDRTVKSALAVLEYIRIYSNRTKLILPSSAAVYGNVASLPIAEGTELRPISLYGLHKKIVEEFCSFYRKRYNLSILIIRLFSVYGNGLKKQLLWDACNKIRAGNYSFWGTGKERRDWIHVFDVAKLFYLANNTSCFINQVVNAGSGKAVSVDTVLRFLLHLFEKNELPVFKINANDGNPKDYQADIQNILKWNWAPRISLEDGIKDYVEWYENNE